ncbi:hypothetical protein [Streptomyces sp. NPDC047706]|uniref:hypothetical protein n=1 Tax=Streptomyces sp. NPDC047706 TaxID=3365486 RepID=UPI00371B33E1
MPTAPQTTDELYQALKENDRRPYGRTRTVTAEELVEAAEQFGEPVALVHALLELQEAYTYGSEPRKSPVVFARVLALFDEQPDVFDERMRHTLFWRFKWVANALRALPEMPLASLRQWLTEMRDRYEKAGLGLQPYYGQAYQLAAHVGEDTTLAYELWAARTRTRLSDCEACEICERALYHLAAGDDERALGVWEGLRLAADWPADAVDTARLHGDLAEACMHLGRHDEALRHLTRSAEQDLRRGGRLDAFCAYSNAAQLTLDLGRVEDCIALLDSLLAEPDVAAGELDDRLVAQLRLTRARALHAGEDLKAATAEFVALAAESAAWDDDPGSHSMIAAETAVLLGESGEFGRARQAADQALAAHAKAPRYEQLSNCLRELARLQAQRQGQAGLADARTYLADAGRIADEARGYGTAGRSACGARGRRAPAAGHHLKLTSMSSESTKEGWRLNERLYDRASRRGEELIMLLGVVGSWVPAPAERSSRAARCRKTLGHGGRTRGTLRTRIIAPRNHRGRPPAPRWRAAGCRRTSQGWNGYA